MKNLLIILLMLLCLPVFADTMPFYTKSVPKNAIGLYQAGNEITLYSEANEKSDIIKTMQFSYKPETMPDGVFALLLNDKKLGFIYVMDIDEDGWVQLLYDKKTGARGWIKTEDQMQFLPWMNFYNLYGRKYGLRLMKDAPEPIKELHAKTEDLSQVVSKLNYVQQIKLTAIRGNWALVSVVDLDKTPKTGYIKWRSSEGMIYAFPNIK